MRPQDIKLGEFYRHVDSPNRFYAKALEILKGRQKENTNTYAVVKCEWTNSKNYGIGFIRYFRPCDLIKERTND
jgi:hypothetical protein